MKRILELLTAFAFVLCLSPTVQGAYTLYLNTPFSDKPSPADNGLGYWIKATFEDVSTNVVKLTLDNQLTGDEFLGSESLYFNIDPGIAINHNEITWARGGSFEASIDFGTDLYKADGDGYFDMLISFGADESTRWNGGGAARVFTLTYDGASGVFSADSFRYLSAGEGGKNGNSNYFGLPAAAHVQGLGPDGKDSTWITSSTGIPEPAALATWGVLALFGGLYLRRRKR
jgi:hypothetical protein